MSHRDSKLDTMKEQVKKLFTAALEYHEGKLTPEQLKSISQRVEWKSKHLLHPRTLSVNTLLREQSAFTCHPGSWSYPIGESLLMGHERAWMTDYKKIALSSTFGKSGR